jgi:hypothetical protein
MPSTVIRHYRYDAANRQLAVVFQSGSRYIYDDVPENVIDRMNKAFSKGEFFNRYIREHYRFVRASADRRR